jgi:hypothetical protein
MKKPAKGILNEEVQKLTYLYPPQKKDLKKIIKTMLKELKR